MLCVTCTLLQSFKTFIDLDLIPFPYVGTLNQSEFLLNVDVKLKLLRTNK